MMKKLLSFVSYSALVLSLTLQCAHAMEREDETVSKLHKAIPVAEVNELRDRIYVAHDGSIQFIMHHMDKNDYTSIFQYNSYNLELLFNLKYKYYHQMNKNDHDIFNNTITQQFGQLNVMPSLYLPRPQLVEPLTLENWEEAKSLRGKAYRISVAASRLSKTQSTRESYAHDFWKLHHSYVQIIKLLFDVKKLDPQGNKEDHHMFLNAFQGLNNMLNFMKTWNFLHEESGMCCRDAEHLNIQ